MNHWDKLIKTALLGTEKSEFDLKSLPDSIRAYTENAPDKDPEARFYTAASLVYLYEKAGQLPENTPIPLLGPAPDETDVICPPAVEQLLETLLSEQNRQVNLLVYCFQQIARKRWVLPYTKLTAVFNLSISPGFKNLQPFLHPIYGNRGAWLVNLNPSWSVLTPNATDQIWESGSLTERRKWLIALRLDDPAQCLALLKTTIEQERNARERKEWIRVLNGQLSSDELLFIQDLYEQLPASKEQDKPIVQETRRLLTEILLSAPLSLLSKDVAVKLERYVLLQKRILGMRAKIAIEIPAQSDDFLCPEIMVQLFGFEAVSPTPGLSSTEFWFCELARCVHPIVWETVFKDRPWSEILGAFAKSNALHSGSKLPLLQHVAHALARTMYRKGILAFVQEYGVDESNYFMLNALHNEELEKMVMNQSQGILPDYLKEVMQRPNWTWSKPFSRFVLQCFIAPRTNGIQYHEYVKMLSMHIHLDLSMLPELEDLRDQPSKNPLEQQMQRSLITPLIHLLQLRKSINNLI